MRAWINCSEPVRLRSFQSFADAFADWGVRMQSLQASYAMAENVFAATQSRLEEVPSVLARGEVRQRSATYEDLAFSFIDDVYASSGEVLKETEIRIMAPDGSPCGEAQTGEIQLRTPCLFSGYWGSDGFVRTAISEDGWYSTGDYGFLCKGNLFVIGRMKDIIIVGGQNVFPEDIEVVVNTIAEVYPGRVVAFGIVDSQIGTENLAVVAEIRGTYDRETATRVERAIRELVLASIGIAPRYVAAVPERWIVKSTAGKISRKETRERFVDERFGAMSGAASGPAAPGAEGR
jgi:acyl-CoA synthetase (AMP-forming)/AMP-acid ligase II